MDKFLSAQRVPEVILPKIFDLYKDDFGTTMQVDLLLEKVPAWKNFPVLNSVIGDPGVLCFISPSTKPERKAEKGISAILDGYAMRMCLR